MNYIFLFYLISGILKTILNHYGINLPFDITLLSGVVLVFDLLFSVIKSNKSYNIDKNLFTLVIIFLAFFIWILISLSYTISDKFAFLKTIAFLTNIIAFLYPILSKKIKVNKFLKLYIFSIIVISIWFIPLLRQNQIQYNLFFAENTSGLYLSLGMNFGIVFILVLFKKALFKSKLLERIILFFSIITLLALGARSPLVALITVLFVFILINGNITKHLKKRFSQNQLILILASFLTSIIILGYFFITNDYLSNLLTRAFSRFSLLFAENKGSSVSVRVEHIYVTIEAIFSNLFNFLFGYGFGSYGLIANGVDARNFPHNIFLETFLELGFIGFIILTMFFLFLAILYKHENYKKNLFLYMIIITMISGSLTDIRIIFAILSIISIDNYKKTQTIKNE